MRVLYFGPIAEEGKPALGGYEAANRKNIDKLRQCGVEVIEFPNPRINYKMSSLGKLAYIRLLFTPFVLLKYAEIEDVVIHHTPLYDKLILPSLWLLWMANRLHIRILIDIRAGSLIENAKTKSYLWRKCARYMLNNASLISVEGKSYIHEIPAVFNVNRKIVYFPNLANCCESKFKPRNTDHINLIYFGRITKHKGVDLLLRMMPLLDDRFRLYLAGPISDDMKAKDLQKRHIFYLGSLSPIELRETLQKMHIFLFPTKWSGEGQSNSLIESMQNGLVPISSDQGFCKEVIADCGIILPNGSTEEDWRDAIFQIASSDIESLGKKAMKHIIECHNIDYWIPWLINQYKIVVEE